MGKAAIPAAVHVEPNNDMGKKTKNPLKQKHPLEWLADIRRLPKVVQSNIARVIWWDFFAEREVLQRWPHLDEYIRQPMIELNKAETVKYLRRCEYTEQQAEARITHENGCN
jgi:hypothetical protein